MLRHHLGGATVVAVLVLPVPDLQAALHHGHAALGEVLADELRGAAPGDDVDEIRLLLAALGLEVPVHGQGEGRHRSPAAGAAQLGIPGQTTHQDDLVQHGVPRLLALADDEGTHDPFGNAQNTVQLLGEGRLAGEAHQDIVPFGLVVDGIGQLAAAPPAHHPLQRRHRGGAAGLRGRPGGRRLLDALRPQRLHRGPGRGAGDLYPGSAPPPLDREDPRPPPVLPAAVKENFSCLSALPTVSWSQDAAPCAQKEGPYVF